MDPIQYKVIFSRRRSISIILSPGKEITVRAPSRTSLKTIDKFVQGKAEWIQHNIRKYTGLESLNKGKNYSDGELHLFMGRKYSLRITEYARPFVKEYDDIIEAGVKSNDDSQKVKSMLDQWYMQMAQQVLIRKVKDILLKLPEYDFSPSAIVVRKLKSRWGSCTYKGKITLNSELIKLDETIFEYVIIHELCHLKYHNHGKEFYRLLSELIPDYKSLRKGLRKFVLE